MCAAASTLAKELAVVIPAVYWRAILVHVYSASRLDLESALPGQAALWLRLLRLATLATVALD